MSPSPRNILITGASTGVGRATAILLARSGIKVFAGVRKASDGDSLRAEDIALLSPVNIDVTELDTIDETIALIGEQVGSQGLYAVVNNAGIALGGPVEFIDREVWLRQFDVNVIGTVTLIQRSLPLLRLAKNSRIVNIGSITGLVAAPLIGPYCASKHALEAITACLRIELARWNMHATVIAPGNVNTPIWDKAESETDMLLGQLSQRQREMYGDQIVEMAQYGIREGRKGVSPDAVARLVRRAVLARRPRHRYMIGPDAWLLYTLSRLLPRTAMEWIIRRRFGV